MSVMGNRTARGTLVRAQLETSAGDYAVKGATYTPTGSMVCIAPGACGEIEEMRKNHERYHSIDHPDKPYVPLSDKVCNLIATTLPAPMESPHPHLVRSGYAEIVDVLIGVVSSIDYMVDVYLKFKMDAVVKLPLPSYKCDVDGRERDGEYIAIFLKDHEYVFKYDANYCQPSQLVSVAARSKM